MNSSSRTVTDVECDSNCYGRERNKGGSSAHDLHCRVVGLDFGTAKEINVVNPHTS